MTENNDKTNASKKGKKGIIPGIIIVICVIVIGIAIYIVTGLTHQSVGYTQEEIESDLADLEEMAKENKFNGVHTGPEDIVQFIQDYEAVSGHVLDYENEISGDSINVYDGVCHMEVTNYNTQDRGKFMVQIKFEGTGRDKYYKSSIQTILKVFGMKEDDIQKLTDGFVSDNDLHYTFDTSFVDQNYHDIMRVGFKSSEKRVYTMKKSSGWIEITAFKYPTEKYAG